MMMFKTFKIAADARRAHALLLARDASPSFTLTANVQRLLNKLDGALESNTSLRQTVRDYQISLRDAENKLRAANAKIDRMTSGLKRGSAKPAKAAGK